MKTAMVLVAVVVTTMATSTPRSGLAAEPAESLLTNGSFAQWTGGVPDGWEVSIGATNGGEQPKSQVSMIAGPALLLRGDAATKAWHAVSQKIPSRGGGRYLLEFETRSKGVKREGVQFDNCYVGAMSFEGKKVIGREIVDVSADTADWTPHRVEFAVPEDADSTTITIFLSKTGLLGVRNVSVTATAELPASSGHADRDSGGDQGLVANGDFAVWSDGRPQGWKVDVGARNGADEPRSEMQKLDDAGLLLSGKASTMAWLSLSQELAVKKGKMYTLTFEARSEAIRREGRQFDNCYVGVMLFDTAGKRLDIEIQDLSQVPRWKKHRISFRVPAKAAKAELLIFLSKSGTLMVKSVHIEETTGQASFPALIESLREHYSFSEFKRIDWDDLGGRYRGAAEKATTPEAFAGAIEGMLAELEDLHVWIEMPDGSTIHPYSSSYRANYDHRAVAAKLLDLREARPVGFTGRTEQGFGVVVVDSLSAADDGVYRRLTDAITGLFDARGFIVDLRSNGGGSEPRAAQIAGLFADKAHVYARAKVRSGPSDTDFRESPPRELGPAIDDPFTRPVVCLIGPGCVSSGENFALMMKALDHVTLVGQATRGASGNPAPVTLPNGLKVWFSRWVDMEPDGTPIEGRGIQPDVRVEHTSPGDPTFDTAVAILSEKTGGAGSAG